MITINFKDKLIALIVWNAEKDDDVHVYLGHLFMEGADYVFKNNEKGWVVSFQADTLDKLEKVPDDLKETLLNADYCIHLTMGHLVDDQGKFIPTGMNWH